MQELRLEQKTLQNKVFEALGEVSMCWSETPKGVFESSRAEEIGNRLMHDIKMQKPVIDEDNMQEYIKQIKDLGIEVVKIEPTIKEAVEVLCNALREDTTEGSLYHAYQCNIAMAFVDEYNRNDDIFLEPINIPKIANRAAKNFLNLLINK